MVPPSSALLYGERPYDPLTQIEWPAERSGRRAAEAHRMSVSKFPATPDGAATLPHSAVIERE